MAYKKLQNSLLQAFLTASPSEYGDLESILEHARLQTKFYRDFNPTDFLSFPVIDKTTVRENFEDMIARNSNPRTCFVNSSGGSTGVPTKILQNKDYLRLNRATKFFYKLQCGYQIGEPLLKLWGDEKEILFNRKSIKGILSNKIKNFVVLNSFAMTEVNLLNYVKILNKTRPSLIVGYAGSMYEFAKFVQDRDLVVERSVNVMTGAGTLYPFMRDKIKEVFGGCVFNRYGGREVGNIAYETPCSKGMEITRDVHVEILDDDNHPVRFGEEGNIVVTSLINKPMPIVRYKIGDRGTLQMDHNGKVFLEKLSGRGMEVFKSIDGRIVPAEFFIHIIGVTFNKASSWIEKFQVIQKELNFIEVKIVKNSHEVEEDLAKIREGIQAVMGNQCVVSFKFVQDIKTLPSGKYLYTKCELS